MKTFYSKILGEKRKISVQTPTRMSKYDQYPVLYVLDGEAMAVLAGGRAECAVGGARARHHHAATSDRPATRVVTTPFDGHRQ